MIYKKGLVVLLLVFLSVGCSMSNRINKSNLNLLSNDDLCRSLGENNDNGNLVLRIYDELKNRGDNINNERCYALEKASVNNTEISITPTVTQSRPERIYDNKKRKYMTIESGTKAGINIH